MRHHRGSRMLCLVHGSLWKISGSGPRCHSVRPIPVAVVNMFSFVNAPVFASGIPNHASQSRCRWHRRQHYLTNTNPVVGRQLSVAGKNRMATGVPSTTSTPRPMHVLLGRCTDRRPRPRPMPIATLQVLSNCSKCVASLVHSDVTWKPGRESSVPAHYAAAPYPVPCGLSCGTQQTSLCDGRTFGRIRRSPTGLNLAEHPLDGGQFGMTLRLDVECVAETIDLRRLVCIVRFNGLRSTSVR